MKKLIQRSTSRKQLLQNTINHFNSNNRSTSGAWDCLYRNKEGRSCAIGRELPDKLTKQLDNLPKPGVCQQDVFNKLPQRLQNMGQGFLITLQNLHDKSQNWTKKGLSLVGKENVDSICQKFNIKGIKYPKHLQ